MKIFQTIARWMVLLAVLISGAAWAQVATVSELSGAAQAIPAAGTPRDLRKGDALMQGETVRTAAGSSAVIRFEDGQVVALSSNSRMAIAAYVYNKMEPAKSSILLNLVEGGMRAVTGLIGKAKPENVTYRAANATIGIRGTDVTIGVSGGNLVVSVDSGKLSFSFGGKTYEMAAGQGTYVPAGSTNAVVLAVNDLRALLNNSPDAPQSIKDAVRSLATLNDLSANNARNIGTGSVVSGQNQTGTVQSVDPTGQFGFGGTGIRLTGSGSGSTGAGGGQNCNVTPKPSGC